jgi:hypothetical protein
MTKTEVLERLAPFLKTNTDRAIIRHFGLGLTPRQISNQGICSYPAAVSRCKAIATVLDVENANLHKAR